MFLSGKTPNHDRNYDLSIISVPGIDMDIEREETEVNLLHHAYDIVVSYQRSCIVRALSHTEHILRKEDFFCSFWMIFFCRSMF